MPSVFALQTQSLRQWPPARLATADESPPQLIHTARWITPKAHNPTNGSRQKRVGQCIGTVASQGDLALRREPADRVARREALRYAHLLALEFLQPRLEAVAGGIVKVPGGLMLRLEESRVDQNAASGAQDAQDFRRRTPRIAIVLESIERYDSIEDRIGEG